MPRDDRLYMDDILESTGRIRTYIAEMTIQQLIADQRTMDAVVRNLEIIGEASRNLSDEIKGRLPEIEWRKIVALRNLLAHEYFGINAAIIWDIIQTKLPLLETVCRKWMELHPPPKESTG